MQRSSPDCSEGFSRFDASIEPPDVAPAPMMVWISSMNSTELGFFLSSRQHGLQPLLEVAAIARAGQQRAHVERVDHRLLQHLGHLALDDLARQALGDRRLADAGLADIERVVLGAAAQHLDGALDLVLAADQRIDPALAGLLVEVDAIGGQRLVALLDSRPRRRSPPPSRETRRARARPGTLALPWLM